MNHKLSSQLISAFFLILILIGLYASSQYNYLLFHTLAEIFSIVIAFSIFVLAWNVRQFLNDNYLLLLGISYFFIAALDLTHTLAYKGMPIFHGFDSNLPTQLWIAARYMESLSLLIAFLLIDKKIKHRLVFLIYTALTALILLSIFSWKIFPACYIEGVGLTAFKKISEYIISLILLASLFILWKEHTELDPKVRLYLTISLFFTIASELAFTFYIGFYDISNFIGHIFKVFSFFFIYLALIVSGFTQPIKFLFYGLKDSEQRYKNLSAQLEEKVVQRTKELRETQEQLFRKQKLAIIGQFAGSLGHELRNPLATMANISYLIKHDQSQISPEYHQYLDILDTEINNASKIVNDLLDFARTKKSQVESVSFRSLIEQVLADEPKPDHISVDLDVSKNLPNLLIDRLQIQQVIRNLVKNAYEAMLNGGSLTIVAKQHDDVASEDTSPKRVPSLEIRFSDTGVGITKENQNNIFEPLYTTKEKGVGLGLITCKILTENNHGILDYESKPGHGTTFILTLPVDRNN